MDMEQLLVNKLYSLFLSFSKCECHIYVTTFHAKYRENLNNGHYDNGTIPTKDFTQTGSPLPHINLLFRSWLEYQTKCAL